MKPWKTLLRVPYRTRVVAVALVLGAAGSAAAVYARAPSGPRYEPSYAFDGGDEVVLVFVVSSQCRAHERDGFPEAVERAKVAAAERAAAEGKQFRVIGAALDWRTGEAGEFLETFGEFDEVALGGNWMNQTVVDYVWNDFPGYASVPQMVLLERRINKLPSSISVDGEKVLRRLRGTEEIEQWAAAGAPFTGPLPPA